jgi:hypothetical protein
MNPRGRSLGALVSVDPGFSSPHAWTYSRDHLETVISGRRVPRVGNSARAFSGWCDPPSVRPLVVVSDTNFRDPQRWRRFAPDDSYRHTLFRRLQVVVNRVIKCSSPEDTGTVWHHGPSDLTYSKSYVDTLGNRLIALGLNPQSSHCDGPPGPQWSPHWFVIGADTSYLGAEMELVDAGDYDADGQSEVLFWHSGYSEDGYSLFFQQFRKRTDFFWTYH